MTGLPASDDADARLLRAYGGVEGKTVMPFDAAKERRRKGKGRLKMKSRPRKRIIDEHWELSHNLTANQAVCIGTERLRERRKLREQRKQRPAGQRSLATSECVEVLAAALMQARAIFREKRRDMDARLRDSVELLQSASRKASRTLMKESDNLWRLGNYSDDEEQCAQFEEEAALKANLAGELNKAVVETNRIRGNLMQKRDVMRSFLKQTLKQIR